jgi:hypothetical protein
MQHAATDVLDVAYEESGPARAPVVLLLHGWPDDVRGWRGVSPRLHAAGFRTIAPWLRGFGSTRFRSPETRRARRRPRARRDRPDGYPGDHPVCGSRPRPGRAGRLHFDRLLWDTWSPAGWFDDAEFEATARSFENPDWAEATLHARAVRPEIRRPGGAAARARDAGRRRGGAHVPLGRGVRCMTWRCAYSAWRGDRDRLSC